MSVFSISYILCDCSECHTYLPCAVATPHAPVAPNTVEVRGLTHDPLLDARCTWFRLRLREVSQVRYGRGFRAEHCGHYLEVDTRLLGCSNRRLELGSVCLRRRGHYDGDAGRYGSRCGGWATGRHNVLPGYRWVVYTSPSPVRLLRLSIYPIVACIWKFVGHFFRAAVTSIHHRGCLRRAATSKSCQC